MATNTAPPIVTLRGLTAKFDAAMASATPFYPQVCTTMPSNGRDENYGWLGSMPGMREWLGDRQFSRLRAASYAITNKLWESSIEIERHDIEDDRLGMYGPVLEQLAIEAAYHPDELFFETLVAGASTACFDGQYFFDTDHSWGSSGTQSNDLTPSASNTAAVTEAEFRTAYHASRAALLGFKNDQGKFLTRPTIRPMPNQLLIVPPALEEVAQKALYKDLVSGGETNIVLDRPQIVASPHLSSGTAFYHLNLSAPLKPFVFQARAPLSRQMKGADDIEAKGVKFMTEARYNVGYLAWWTATLNTFT